MMVNTALWQTAILSSCLTDVFTFQLWFLLILSAKTVPPTNPVKDVLLIFLFSIFTKPLPGEWLLTALELLSGAVLNSGTIQEYSVLVVVTQPYLFLPCPRLDTPCLMHLHLPLLYSHTGWHTHLLSSPLQNNCWGIISSCTRPSSLLIISIFVFVLCPAPSIIS